MIKTHLKIYWRVWILSVALILLIRFTLLVNSEEGSRFNLFTVYALLTWIAVIGVSIYEARRFFSYLENHHKSKWEEITYVPIFGSGGHNAFRSLPFIYSKDDLGDTNVQMLKDNNKGVIKLLLTVFISFIFIFWAVMIDSHAIADFAKLINR
jgi:hypothetical protein